MKRLFLYIIGIGLLMAGCDKESSDNGDLDGFWQMTEKMDGFCGTMGGADMRQSGLTWAFQGHILELRDVTDHQKDIMMSFEHKGGELRVYNPYFVERDSGDIKITDATPLIPYGISQPDDTFQVVELSSSEMVLSSTNCSLRFRKY